VHARSSSSRWDPFVAALLAVAVVGTLVPAAGETYDVLRIVAMVAIGLLFFLYGVRLSTGETIAGLVNWRLHIAILTTTFVAFPLAGLALRGLVEPVVGAGLAAGVLLLCLVPSTVQSNVVFTRMAGGDTAGAVVAASMSNLIGVFLTPALVALLMSARAEVSPESVVRIVLQFLAPFVLGQLIRPWLGPWVTRNDGWLKHVDRSSILLVVYLAFSAGMTAGVWSKVSAWAVLAIIALCLGLLAAACGLLVGLGRLVELTRPARIALLFCGSNKSLATGLPMAAVLFPAREVALIVLPLMIYHQLQIIAGGVIAARLAQRS
jgi:sodium/bile acid cotransporter 7